MGEGQREETQNLKQAPGSELSAQSLMRGWNSRTANSRPGRSRTLNRLRHPGAPNVYLFLRERERQADTESETGSSLRAVSTEPDAGLELKDFKIMA